MVAVQAFLGNAVGQISSLPQYSATGFHEPTITADIDSLQNHVAVQKLERGIAISKKGGTFEAAVFAFIIGLDTVRRRMKKLVSGARMNDGNTQLVVDMLAVVNILIQKISQAFPNGIPIEATRKAEGIIQDINDYAKQLRERRQTQMPTASKTNYPYNYAVREHSAKKTANYSVADPVPGPLMYHSKQDYGAVREHSALKTTDADYTVADRVLGPLMHHSKQDYGALNKQEPRGSIRPAGLPDGPSPSSQPVISQPPVDTGIPGGGAAGSSGQILDTDAPVDASGDVAIEKTALQKYGPVAALAAGGLAAYLALR